MTDRPDDPPRYDPTIEEIDRPAVARMYDYYLGGALNFAADRTAAQAAIDAAPQIVAIARANRGFVLRVVHVAAEAGIRQFLDLGSGLVSVGSVHDTAHHHDPAARIVYIDHDPIVVAHLRALFGDDPRIAVLGEDIRHLSAILDQIVIDELLDIHTPVAVLCASVAHFIDGDIATLLTPLRELVPGSMLAISHATTNPAHIPAGQLTDVQRAYAAASRVYPRTDAEILAMFTGFPLMPPDTGGSDTTARLVPVNIWRPEPGPPPQPIPGLLAGVGIRPTPTDSTTPARPAPSSPMHVAAVGASGQGKHLGHPVTLAPRMR